MRSGGAAHKLYSAANFIYFFAILHEYGTNFEQWALSLERDSHFVTDLHDNG